ncbi:MAG: hypothetical protein GWP91_15900, partial [Rhodobacterales bacterium]|nr:hypothetical protein [Rhodobacterales bacterium]
MLSSALLLILACKPLSTGDIPVSAPLEAPQASSDGHLAYHVSFPAPHTHYVEVEAIFPTDGADQLTLMMPVWTPGSYLVREYVQHVENMQVQTPATIDVSSKNRWTVQTGGADAVRLTYRVYSHAMAVQGNWVDADFAMLNGAPTFITRVDALARPHEVTVTLPDGWAEVWTALPDASEGKYHWIAPNYDVLVDSPIVAGNPKTHTFDVSGVPHTLVNLGGDEVWDHSQSVEDVQKIVQIQTEFWGDIPYPEYQFLNVIAEARGGLEHKRSTLMLTSRWMSRDEEAYRGWLGLVSHEFFHTWNVKRLRPVNLGPFDYETEVHTDDLWVAEGCTSYYDDLLLVRAGLYTEEQYLERLGKNIKGLQTTPGRLIQPVADASRDAWIKHYRKNENSGNTQISYYIKGAVVAFLLDAKIRETTVDTRSLDDVMRLAYKRYGGDKGYTSQQFRDLCSEVAGTNLDAFFAEAVDGTSELDYGPALTQFGLELPAEPMALDNDEPWIGLHTNGSRVNRVERGTPAWEQGFNVDEIG